MSELIARLRAMRAELVETMAKEIVAEGDWHTWLPLLAQVQTCLQAVEAVASSEGKETIEARE